MMKGIAFWIGMGLTASALYLTADSRWPATSFRKSSTLMQPAFPSMKAANLEGNQYALPEHFEGETNLCLFAFTREQQDEVDTWLTGLKPLQGARAIEIYEFPTLSKGTPMFRTWLDGVMRRGIGDKKQRERTITLYLDKKAFRDDLEMPDELSIYALLIDRKGNILWRDKGRFTAEKGAELAKVVEQRSSERSVGTK